MKYTVIIKGETPIHLSSGKANVNVDSDVVHDNWGLPYFPAKRFKGLLYESALELVEMAEQSGTTFVTSSDVERLFNRGEEDQTNLIISDFHIPHYEKLKREWEYLQKTYPKEITANDVLERYTSIRYQTAINAETGVAMEGSLRNLRVVDSPCRFEGVVELTEAVKDCEGLLALALQNLRSAGLKRNRGFGQITCFIKDEKTQSQLVAKALEGMEG